MGEQIKKLLKEAELYHSQGLLNEALIKYNQAESLIQRNRQIKDRLKLMDAVSKKIQILKEDIQRIESAPKRPEVPAKIQDLIKKLFTFSPDLNEDARTLEGAVALAKFGQFKRAISEFDALLKRDSFRVAAAKNIIRCHIALSSVDDALIQYDQWISQSVFLPNQLHKLHVFFENILKKEGINKTLPQPGMSADPKETRAKSPEMDQFKIRVHQDEKSKIDDDEDLDINSIGITLNTGTLKGQVFEFKVRFQLGKVLSLLISSRDKELIENFKVGATIDEVQYYSNIAFFNAKGVVKGVKEIKVGPLRGDYCVDVEVKIN